MRLLVSYVNAMYRPFGEVTRVRLALGSRVKLTVFAFRSRIDNNAALCGEDAKKLSGKISTVPFFSVSVHPFPFHTIFAP